MSDVNNPKSTSFLGVTMVLELWVNEINGGRPPR